MVGNELSTGFIQRLSDKEWASDWRKSARARARGARHDSSSVLVLDRAPEAYYSETRETASGVPSEETFSLENPLQSLREPFLEVSLR